MSDANTTTNRTDRTDSTATSDTTDRSEHATLTARERQFWQEYLHQSEAAKRAVGTAGQNLTPAERDARIDQLRRQGRHALTLAEEARARRTPDGPSGMGTSQRWRGWSRHSTTDRPRTRTSCRRCWEPDGRRSARGTGPRAKEEADGEQRLAEDDRLLAKVALCVAEPTEAM